ncbi:38911_t:CDS:2, partial [Gigaspora margarita]
KELIAEELELASSKIKDLETALLSANGKIGGLEARIKDLESKDDNSAELERLKRELVTEKQKKYQKKQAQREKIDWACSRMKTNPMLGSFPGQEFSKFKILPAHQFHLVTEAKRADDPLLFRELLSDLNTEAELVFIPVNNPNFHWSLLVFETRSKKFYHWDTLRGANYGYVEPLVKELLSHTYQTNNPNWQQLLNKQHNIPQNNGYDCGVAVIAIIRKIIELSADNRDDLGEMDFKQERQELRERYLAEAK